LAKLRIDDCLERTQSSFFKALLFISLEKVSNRNLSRT